MVDFCGDTNGFCNFNLRFWDSERDPSFKREGFEPLFQLRMERIAKRAL